MLLVVLDLPVPSFCLFTSDPGKKVRKDAGDPLARPAGLRGGVETSLEISGRELKCTVPKIVAIQQPLQSHTMAEWIVDGLKELQDLRLKSAEDLQAGQTWAQRAAHSSVVCEKHLSKLHGVKSQLAQKIKKGKETAGARPPPARPASVHC
jgi:hypothetical protein